MLRCSGLSIVHSHVDVFNGCLPRVNVDENDVADCLNVALVACFTAELVLGLCCLQR